MNLCCRHHCGASLRQEAPLIRAWAFGVHFFNKAAVIPRRACRPPMAPARGGAAARFSRMKDLSGFAQKLRLWRAGRSMADWFTVKSRKCEASEL